MPLIRRRKPDQRQRDRRPCRVVVVQRDGRLGALETAAAGRPAQDRYDRLDGPAHRPTRRDGQHGRDQRNHCEQGGHRPLGFSSVNPAGGNTAHDNHTPSGRRRLRRLRSCDADPIRRSALLGVAVRSGAGQAPAASPTDAAARTTVATRTANAPVLILISSLPVRRTEPGRNGRKRVLILPARLPPLNNPPRTCDQSARSPCLLRAVSTPPAHAVTPVTRGAAGAQHHLTHNRGAPRLRSASLAMTIFCTSVAPS